MNSSRVRAAASNSSQSQASSDSHVSCWYSSSQNETHFGIVVLELDKAHLVRAKLREADASGPQVPRHADEIEVSTRQPRLVQLEEHFVSLPD
jgi:hypothetical protein